MHVLLDLCTWLEKTTVGSAVRDSLWLFPAIETLHVFGIVSLVGSTSLLDLRLLNLAVKEVPVSKLAARTLPWAWFGFTVQVTTGLLMFSSEAVKMAGNIGFQIKMLLILTAGINAMIFHTFTYRSVTRWDNSPAIPPVAAKIAGTCSIILWFGIVAAGRLIAYV